MTVPDRPQGNGLLHSVRLYAARRRRARREGEPGVARYLAQVGTLGWMVVTPALIGLFLGRWLDRSFGTGIFWSAPLLMLGVALGCWSGWRWMHRE
ncbi:AtpZ/AtpI family protein [Roseomonas sp. E05]|uniref:AtpZ/AtpI family protein n=1 Tax=Roseomonas sp. E05 TaxID=3046310 RepID=UPI0024BA5B7D|nr:AtpZ/AtpI family protein [Roseomonas sp. E05]MDJ0390514.1 AtpZ/AtpI family protein [Roseomonas sp. E05]